MLRQLHKELLGALQEYPQGERRTGGGTNELSGIGVSIVILELLAPQHKPTAIGGGSYDRTTRRLHNIITI